MTPIPPYRKHATACLVMSRKALTVSERLTLMEMAQDWIVLGKQAEANPVVLDQRVELMQGSTPRK